MAISPIVSRHLLPALLKLLYASLRISVSAAPSELPLPVRGTILAFWHGKMVAGWLLARTLFPERNISAVISHSEDGRILADALEQLGFSLIRGSSSKGGDEVKRAMQEALDRGGIVALTPDGPRGPLNQFKYGTLRLASSNHYPLLFADVTYAKSWTLKSWDRFEIPKPFSRATIVLRLIDLPEFNTEGELRLFTGNLSDRLTHA